MSFTLRRFSILCIAIFLVGACGAARAQQEPQGKAPSSQVQSGKSAQQAPAQPAPGINQEFSVPLTKESERAAGQHKEENPQEKMVEELKHSASVRWLAKLLHVSADAGSWAGFLINFGLLALLIFWAAKKNVPAMFRTRTQTIQRGIEDARKASEEARQRLSDIEARLARLDSEVGDMRATAEKEAAAEEERIRAAAAEDTRKVVAAAESEIAAAAKQAQRELKAFAVDLAVDLAGRRMKVDQATDQALVRRFVNELSTAETPGGNGSGTEGGGK